MEPIKPVDLMTMKISLRDIKIQLPVDITPDQLNEKIWRETERQVKKFLRRARETRQWPAQAEVTIDDSIAATWLVNNSHHKKV